MKIHLSRGSSDSDTSENSFEPSTFTIGEPFCILSFSLHGPDLIQVWPILYSFKKSAVEAWPELHSYLLYWMGRTNFITSLSFKAHIIAVVPQKFDHIVLQA